MRHHLVAGVNVDSVDIAALGYVAFCYKEEDQ